MILCAGLSMSDVLPTIDSTSWTRPAEKKWRGLMPGQLNEVKTLLECRRCNHREKFCVPVRRGVPPELRCDHPTHGSAAQGAGGGFVCPNCRCSWRDDWDRLSARVEEALRANLREWMRLGAVLLECG